MTTSRTLLLLGSTGAVGRETLRTALASSAFSSIHALGRSPPSVDPSVPGSTKLVTSPVIDFDLLLPGDESEVRKLRDTEADVVVITLGTSKAKAGSVADFERIDRECVVAAARAARREGASQTLIYCSSMRANSGSRLLYLRSKGLTEEALAKLNYTETIIFRPGFLIVPGGRAGASHLVAWLTSHLVSIETPLLGSAIVRAAADGIAGPHGTSFAAKETLKDKQVWVVGNSEAKRLGVAQEDETDIGGAEARVANH